MLPGVTVRTRVWHTTRISDGHQAGKATAMISQVGLAVPMLQSARTYSRTQDASAYVNRVAILHMVHEYNGSL